MKTVIIPIEVAWNAVIGKIRRPVVPQGHVKQARLAVVVAGGCPILGGAVQQPMYAMRSLLQIGWGRTAVLVAAAILIIGFALSIAHPVWAIQEDNSSRLDARVFFEKNRDRVRALMDSDPNEAGIRLEWDIVRPMGDDPRVLAFLEELISRSTSSFAAEVVLAETRTIIDYYPEEVKKTKGIPVVVRIAERGLRSPSVSTRLMAAEVLRALGPQYDTRLQAAYLDIFAGEVVSIVTDDAREDMIKMVRRLLGRAGSDKRVRRSIKAGTEKYNLLAFFRSRIEVPQQPGTLAERMKDFEVWQRIMRSKE